eukprot:1191251-Prorocentrum_minimum.AAC.6
MCGLRKHFGSAFSVPHPPFFAMRQVEQRLEGRPGLGALTEGGALGKAPPPSEATADLLASRRSSDAGSGSASSPSDNAPSSGEGKDVPSSAVPTSSGVSPASGTGQRMLRIDELVHGCKNSSEEGTGALSVHRCCISVASVIPTAGNGIGIPLSCSADNSSADCHSTKFVVLSWCCAARRAPPPTRGVTPVPEVEALLCAEARSCSRTAAAASISPEAAVASMGTGGLSPSPWAPCASSPLGTEGAGASTAGAADGGSVASTAASSHSGAGVDSGGASGAASVAASGLGCGCVDLVEV